MKFIKVFVLSIISLVTYAQENYNLDLVANVDVSDQVNDIWGYVGPDGTEYAIMTSADYTRIYSLEDPSNPNELLAIDGHRNAVHRDIKSNGEYLYVTCDQGQDGLLIINMTDVDSIEHVFWQPRLLVDGVENRLTTCHNLYIDENGVCYLAGCGSLGVGGILILDITTDPMEPSLIGYIQERYAHDVYVRGDSLYASEINAGVLSIYDVTDKANYSLLGQTGTSFDFTHNAWISDNGQYVYTTDERANAFVDSYDITDMEDIQRLDVFQPLETAGNGVIPHNTHFINDYLVTSWYTDGVVITDVSDPTNMVKVGSYDTFLGPHGDYNGCWGAYPWLPSGLVLASDRQTGLYVLRPNYVRAAYLHGTVTDMESGSVINNVAVEIIANELNNANTNALGAYKSGIASPGTYDVRFSHPDYTTKVLSADIRSGEITILDAELEKLRTFNLTGNVVSDLDGAPIENAKVRFLSNDRDLTFTTNGNGDFSAALFEETYEVVVGAWGYKHVVVSQVDPANPGDLSYRLPKGYMDDFVLDLGWEETSNASAGIWVREVPIETRSQGQLGNIGIDNPLDIGNECFMTGNGGGDIWTDDIDDGTTRILSPSMDLTDNPNPIVEFEYYFFNGGNFGSAPNDYLTVSLLENGSNLVEVASYTDNTNFWSEVQEIKVNDFIDDLSNVQVMFTSADDEPGHWVEAAVDVFRVTEGFVSSTNELINETIVVSPNPFVDETVLHLNHDYNNLELYNLQGMLLLNNTIDSRKVNIGRDLDSGIYFVKLYDKQGNYKSIKMIKQ